MIKCIAIDDQYSSLEGLDQYIQNTPNMRLIKTYTDPLTALNELIKSDPVDVIFMDIDMPQISGIELSKAIRQKTKKLIFTTSHQEYAFEAFEVEGDAYLLKPYSYAKFATTLARLFLDMPEIGERNKDFSKDEYFLVKNKEEEHRTVMVKYSDIIAFESFHNYVKIHTVQKVIIAYLSLKDIKEQLLLNKQFIQLHRAYIIAISHIMHIENTRITLSNKIGFNVGDIYYKDFREFFSEKIIISSRKK